MDIYSKFQIWFNQRIGNQWATFHPCRYSIAYHDWLVVWNILYFSILGIIPATNQMVMFGCFVWHSAASSHGNHTEGLQDVLHEAEVPARHLSGGMRRSCMLLYYHGYTWLYYQHLSTPDVDPSWNIKTVGRDNQQIHGFPSDQTRSE